MALGSTQPLVKMSTRNIPGGKGGPCVRLTTSPLSCAECHEIWETKPSGTLWATPGLLGDDFTFSFTYCIGGWVGPRAGLDGWGKYRPLRGGGGKICHYRGAGKSLVRPGRNHAPATEDSDFRISYV
jgi:hypothetical protein